MRILSTYRCANCGWQSGDVIYPLELAAITIKALDVKHARESTTCRELILKTRY